MRTLLGDRVHQLDLAGVDPRSAHVFGAFMRTLALHRQVMVRTLAEEGTPPAQAMCLRILAAHGGASQRELGGLLHLSAPTVTSMLKRMERHGTITRQPDPQDQRMTRVRLTPTGLRTEAKLRAILAAQIGRLLDPMPGDDRRELARLLDQLAERMTTALDEPLAAPATEGGAR